MRILLDTHAFLWAVATPDELAEAAVARITDPTTTVLVSAVVAWEVAIKRRLGRLHFDGDVAALTRRHRFTPLSISLAHAAAVEHLPPVHRDPFDRLLVAQARAEDATLLTRDADLVAYDVGVLPA